MEKKLYNANDITLDGIDGEWHHFRHGGTISGNTFGKVVVSGWHTNDVEVKCRNDDELSVPEIAEIQTEEFSTTIILKEPVCPDALRLEFPQSYVELYEIEIF